MAELKAMPTHNIAEKMEAQHPRLFDHDAKILVRVPRANVKMALQLYVDHSAFYDSYCSNAFGKRKWAHLTFYYKSQNPSYRVLPPYRADCLESLAEQVSPMQMIYPKQRNTKIYVPIDLDGQFSRTVFKVAQTFSQPGFNIQ